MNGIHHDELVRLARNEIPDRRIRKLFDALDLVRFAAEAYVKANDEQALDNIRGALDAYHGAAIEFVIRKKEDA